MNAISIMLGLLLLPIALNAVEGTGSPMVLDYTIYIVGTPQKVWAALTMKEQVDQYYMCPQQQFELKVGGAIAYGMPGKTLLSGTVAEIKEGVHLVYSLAMGKGAETKVELDLEEASPGVTILELKQSSATWTGKDQGNYQYGWPVILSGLKTLVETGQPIPWKKRE